MLVYRMDQGVGVVVLSQLLTLVSGRGATMSSSYDDSNVFVPNPQDPAPVTANFTPPGHPNTTLMTYVDLGYYADFYARYASFAASADRPLWDEDRGVCLNFAAGDNGSYLGAFSCPLPFEPEEFTACCGFDNVEFCCLSEAFLKDHQHWLLVTDWVFLFILLGFLILGPLLWMCCGANWSPQDLVHHCDCSRAPTDSSENIYEKAAFDRNASKSKYDYKLYVGDSNKGSTVSEVEELAVCRSISETSGASEGSKRELVEA